MINLIVTVLMQAIGNGTSLKNALCRQQQNFIKMKIGDIAIGKKTSSLPMRLYVVLNDRTSYRFVARQARWEILETYSDISQLLYYSEHYFDII